VPLGDGIVANIGVETPLTWITTNVCCKDKVWFDVYLIQ
jgi:hypothetical protein